MSNYKLIIPFIKQEEGGLSRNPTDKAAKFPCPFVNPKTQLKGYHTNKGITWSTWYSVNGSSQESANRFFEMSDADWGVIFKKYYWDKCLGDLITNQNIANMIVDWVWMSGVTNPEKDVQEILITVFGKHIGADGAFGQATIDSINSVNQIQEYIDIANRRKEFYENIVKENPSQQEFLADWLGRVDRLTKFNNNGYKL